MDEEVAVGQGDGPLLAVVRAGDSQAVVENQQNPVQLQTLRVFFVHYELFHQVFQKISLRPYNNLRPRQTT